MASPFAHTAPEVKSPVALLGSSQGTDPEDSLKRTLREVRLSKLLYLCNTSERFLYGIHLTIFSHSTERRLLVFRGRSTYVCLAVLPIYSQVI